MTIVTTSGLWFLIQNGEIIERSWGAPAHMQTWSSTAIRAAGWYPGIAEGYTGPAHGLDGQGVEVTEVITGDVVKVTYALIPHTLASIRPLAKAKVTERRYAREIAGVAVAGVTVKTDRDSQALINGAFVAAQAGVLTHFDFKAADGWISLTAAQVQAVAAAVAQHVQAAFTDERQLHEQIDAADSVAAVRAIIDSLDG